MTYGSDDRSYVTVQFHRADHEDLVNMIRSVRDEHYAAGRAREADRASVLLMMATEYATIYDPYRARVIAEAPTLPALVTVPDAPAARPGRLRRLVARIRTRHAEIAL